MPTPITDKFLLLRLESGLSRDELAKRMGYAGGSSIQRYEDPAKFNKEHLPAHVVEALVKALTPLGVSKTRILALGNLSA